jgi:hypothetical protein
MQNIEMNEIKDALDGIKSEVKNQIDSKVKEHLDVMQNHLDKLDIKLQSANSGGSINSPKTDLKESLTKSLYSKENEVKNLTNDKLQIKSIFTSDVTGLKPHSFRNDVVIKPRALVNVTDLIGKVDIQGGSYSYAVETVTGAPAEQVEGSAKADVSIEFEYKTVSTDFIAGVTEVSRQFLNNFSSLAQSIPSILDREYYKAENTLYSTALFAAATESTVTGDNLVQVLTKEVAKMMGNNYSPTAIVLNPVDYSNLLLNETNSTSGYDLPAVVTISPQGMVYILGVPVYMANWVTAEDYIVFNGSKVLDCVQENLNLQIDNSEKFSKNISIFRVEKQANIAILAPYEVIKGSIA